MTDLTGDEAWLETPAGRNWKGLFDNRPDHLRWAPKQVEDALLQAERIIATAAGAVGPRTYPPPAAVQAIGSGSLTVRFQPHEVTWAEKVSLWPRLHLIDEADARRYERERHAIRIWLRKETGGPLSSPDWHEYKSRNHRNHRKRGFLIIATGLMRARVPLIMSTPQREAEPEVVEHHDPRPLPDPGSTWHDDDAQPVRFRHDESAEERAALVDMLALDVMDAVEAGATRSRAVQEIVEAHVEMEYQGAPETLRAEHSRDRRVSDLRAAVIARIVQHDRAAYREAVK